MTTHYDVLIVGAGLSGIGAAYHLQKECPHKTYAIIEGREAIGGTWDLFRYPGIRSDSDIFTFGYSFRPWKGAKSIADGPSILNYIRDTAKESGVDQKIQFGITVSHANWLSDQAIWQVQAKRNNGEVVTFTCNLLWMCSGYYRYDEGYTPEFEGVDAFKGMLVHPQKWPEHLDYTGKNVLIIGSGATAVTLLPAMTDKAAHVTMLQRSPSYVISVPENDALAILMRKFLPEMAVYRFTRLRNVLLTMLMFQLSKRKPAWVKKALIWGIRKQVGEQFDMRHFTPKYNPWDERLCAVPDGDMFKAIKAGKASVVTDFIDRFTEKGIALKSGKTLEADVIITATGLKLLPLGGLTVSMDGRPVNIAESMTYKGMMLGGVPNLVQTSGYTNAAWTLKADLVAEYTCRILKQMDQKGLCQFIPQIDPTVTPEPFLNLQSGYILRAVNLFPKQGSRAPWKLYQNYFLDLINFRYKDIEDGVLILSNPKKQSTTAEVVAAT